MGIYEKSIVEALQTKIILTNPEINIQPGAIVSQIYGSNSQKEALLLDKITEGFGEFPSIVSSEQFFVERGGSFFMEAPDNTPGTINTTGNTLSNIESVFPPGKLVQQVLDSGWSPVYNPCAIPKGGKRPTVNVGKSRLEFGLQGERSDFGPRTHPTDPGLLQFHEGQDMSAGPAYPIVAVASGEITIIKMDKTRDKKGSETQRQPKSKEMCYITIKHDTNEVLRNEKIEVHTTYMHLLRIADSNSVGRRLQVGDRVTAGQAIALTGGGKGWPGSGRTAGVHLHFEIGVRKAKSGGGFDYDEYEAESKDQKGVNPGDKPRTAMYSGDKKRGGAMRLGCVDPLHFKYPNLNSFSNDAETRDLIKSFIPITIRERAEKEKSAEEKAAKDAEFAKTKKRVITAAGLVSPVLTVIGAVGGGQVYATKAAVDYISAPIPDEEDTGFTITASPEETE